MPGSFARVARADDVPVGTKRAFEVGGRAVLVCHAPERWYAVSNLCSHASEKLECGRMVHGRISCPVHGARFDLATGRALNAPATQPIPTFEIRIVEDWIEVLV